LLSPWADLSCNVQKFFVCGTQVSLSDLNGITSEIEKDRCEIMLTRPPLVEDQWNVLQYYCDLDEITKKDVFDFLMTSKKVLISNVVKFLKYDGSSKKRSLLSALKISRQTIKDDLERNWRYKVAQFTQDEKDLYIARVMYLLEQSFIIRDYETSVTFPKSPPFDLMNLGLVNQKERSDGTWYECTIIRDPNIIELCKTMCNEHQKEKGGIPIA
jgi:hypothetical protein